MTSIAALSFACIATLAANAPDLTLIAGAIERELQLPQHSLRVSSIEQLGSMPPACPAVAVVKHTILNAKSGRSQFVLRCSQRTTLPFVVVATLPRGRRISPVSASKPSVRAGERKWLLSRGEGFQSWVATVCLQNARPGERIKLREHKGKRLYTGRLDQSGDFFVEER